MISRKGQLLISAFGEKGLKAKDTLPSLPELEIRVVIQSMKGYNLPD